ncbi:putative oxalocrotonate tautomerase [Mycena floridula]|nr:putative oxalocrotonate tautomerase [Mycena floridula]
MPLHRIYVPPSLYSEAEKAALAGAITKIYSFMPSFYVVVIFIDVPKTNYFVGGQKTDNFVRFVVHHVARHIDGDADKRNFMDKYETVLAPFTRDKGVDWEVQVAELDRVLWNENGMAPPLSGTEEEKLWQIENRAVPYKDTQGYQ